MSLLQHAREECGAGQEVEGLHDFCGDDVLEAGSAVPGLADAATGPRQLGEQTADGPVGRSGVHFCSGLALDASHRLDVEGQQDLVVDHRGLRVEHVPG